MVLVWSHTFCLVNIIIYILLSCHYDVGIMALYLSVIQTTVDVISFIDTNSSGGNKLMRKIILTWLVGACGVAVYTILIVNDRMDNCLTST